MFEAFFKRPPIVQVLALIVAVIPLASFTAMAAPPPIRLSASNQVPACVTPSRLMAFLATRNKRLNPNFREIAEWYRYHGESWQVRWDYAFYQMAIETNFLTYRAPNGRWGDVDPKQNNFAGIGTTGGGVPGNSFPDVSAGVLAQIQHLVVYSGEPVAEPVAQRTRLKQGIILDLSRPIAEKRPVTFQDLSGRWAVDKRYGRSIEYVARLYRKRYCKSKQRPVQHAAGWTGATGAKLQLAREPKLAKRQANRARPQATRADQADKRPPAPGVTAARRPSECRVQLASYGGSSTVLVRSGTKSHVVLTALDVDRAQQTDLTDAFIKQYATGGQAIAVFRTRAEALVRAHAICEEMTQ